MSLLRTHFALCAVLLLLAACSDTTFSVNNSPPGAAILSPEDGFTAPTGSEVLFRGQGSDRSTASTELTVVWSSSRDGTLLEGSTWYTMDMGPAPYWQIWGDVIVHRIHLRVLEHVRSLAEADAGR